MGVTQEWLEAHPDREVTVTPDPHVLAEHTSNGENRPGDLTALPETTEHRNWRMDIRQLAGDQGVDADPTLVIQGLTDGDGNAVAGWYDLTSDRFVVVPTASADSLLFLGLDSDEQRALLYDQSRQAVMFTGLLDDAALAAAFGDDHVLEANAHLSFLVDPFADFNLTVTGVTPFDANQYLVTTANGLGFLVGDSVHPSLAVVLDSWEGSLQDLQLLMPPTSTSP